MKYKGVGIFSVLAIKRTVSMATLDAASICTLKTNKDTYKDTYLIKLYATNINSTLLYMQFNSKGKAVTKLFFSIQNQWHLAHKGRFI